MTARTPRLSSIRDVHLRLVKPDRSYPASAAIAASLAGRRGCLPCWYPHGRNVCPSCGNQTWLVGRTSAECTSCELPLPFANLAARPVITRPKGE